ncbi:MAG: (Fe-S)-binding protein [Myxococcales bacterium]|nr:(Fe-S)-binding protein [Myxococcales bacterium]
MPTGEPTPAGTLFYALAAVALAVAAVGAVRRIAQWRGGPPARSSGKPLRLLADILFAWRLRRGSWLRMVLHGCIMYGAATLFFVGSLGDLFLGLGIFSGSKDTPWFAAVNNLAGVALLLGVAAVVVRKLVRRRGARFTREEAVLYGLLAASAVTGYATQAARQAQAGQALYLTVWWMHAALALATIAVAPYTRLFHVVATPAGLVRGGRGTLLAVLDSCTHCGLCTTVCEAHGARPVRELSPCARMEQFGRLLREERAPSRLGRLVQGKPLAGEALAAFELGTFGCTTCARCSVICPAGIDLVPLWKELRARCASLGRYPPALDRAREAIRETANVLNFPNVDRSLWVDLMDDPPPDGYRRDRAEVLYYVGCMSSFSPAAQSIPQAFAGVLAKLGCDFSILGDRESCCGFPLLVAGRPEEAEALRQANLARVRQMGARRILFTCPSCYHTWRTQYAPSLPGVSMQHATEFLAEALPRSGLKLDGAPGRRTVTYHDPCDLGRNGGVYAPPREVLSMLMGVELREPGEARETSRCCGGGGDLEISDPELTRAIAGRALEALSAPGAEVLVTACPQCKRTLAPEATRRGMQTMDLVELVLASMPKSHG